MNRAEMLEEFGNSLSRYAGRGGNACGASKFLVRGESSSCVATDNPMRRASARRAAKGRRMLLKELLGLLPVLPAEAGQAVVYALLGVACAGAALWACGARFSRGMVALSC